MVDTQHFCLRWNNYQSSITSAFENLRDDEDFVDVTLACDGKSLKAHRVVLSACSPYFRELLKSTPCKHPVIVLQDVAFTDLHALVEFIYHGEVNVHQRSLSSFLKTAEVLRVSGLTQQHAEDRDVVTPRTPVAPAVTPQNHTSLPPQPADDAPSPGTNGNVTRRFSANRRERRNSTEHQITENDYKRIRHDHNLNNNLSEQLTPTDFSPTAMKNAVNSILQKNNDQDGNGIDSPPRSPHLPTQRPNNNEDDVKNEPVDASLDLDNNSNDSAGGGTLAKGPPSSCSAGDHDDHDSPIHPAFLSSDSKLFATAAGSFNFSMAALTADPSTLAGLGNQGLQNNSDGLAGTSQGGFAVPHINPFPTDLQNSTDECRVTGSTLTHGIPSSSAACAMQALGMYPEVHYGSQEGEQCHICGKWLRNKITLKRHIQDLHCLQTEEYWCRICNKMYRTRNSLVVHMCNYHQKKKDPSIFPNISKT